LIVKIRYSRLKHAQEYAEQECKKAAHEVRIAQAKKKKEETARLEQAAAEERERKRQVREGRQGRVARQQYDHRWRALLSDVDDAHGRLKFVDIPWPILDAYKAETSTAPRVLICVEHLTETAIRKFLLPVSAAPTALLMDDAKEKRDRLREAMLRFHPDKFEGRMMRFVAEGERGLVREGIAQVVRVLNGLLVEQSKVI
jgi:membrane-bound lytic murein transglycosylase